MASLHRALGATSDFQSGTLLDSVSLPKVRTLRDFHPTAFCFRLAFAYSQPARVHKWWRRCDSNARGLHTTRLTGPLPRKWRMASVLPRPQFDLTRFSRPVQPAYICLPSRTWCRRKDLHLHGVTRLGLSQLRLHFATPANWYPRQESHLQPSAP